MQKIQRYLTTPVFLIGLAILAFGLQALWLGYYLDDWVFLYHLYRGGYERLAAYSFAVNRPLGAWPWWVGFKLLGYSPVLWQVWSLVWRWLTVVLLWAGWKQIWPDRKGQISLACALFLVYPVFIQQTAAVTFSDHWICFALYAASILLMIYANRNRRLYYPLTALALVFSGVQLFTLEYFVGLELIRPVLLWFLFGSTASSKARVKQTLLAELPYAAVLGSFLIWRFGLMPTPGFDRNKPEFLYDLISRPLETLGTLGIKGLQDTVEMLLGAWYKTYDPSTLTLAPVSNLVSWGLAGLVMGLALAFFSSKARHEADPVLANRQAYPWMALNFAVMVAGLLPAWAVGQHVVSTGNYADRFGLAAMFGASLLIVSLASFLLKARHQLVLVCLLMGLAAGYHFRLANQYRWAWENQTRLAWQLSWRIPGLQPQTVIYGDGTLANGSWVDIAWLNFLYETPAQPNQAEAYWYYDLNKFSAGALPEPGQAITEQRIEHLAYQGSTSDRLVIQFKSVPGQCLWVVSSGDLPNPHLTPGVRAAVLPDANPRISAMAQQNPNLGQIFRPEPARDWCYYFEQAQRAADEKQWSTIQDLWQAADRQGLKTGVAVEYLPFIDGLARAGDFETALALSARAKSIDIAMHDPLCQTWQRIFDEGQDTPVKARVIEQLDCAYLIK